MTKEVIKKSIDNLYGFTIDFSFLDAIFYNPYSVETIDIDYEDITHQKRALKPGKTDKKRYRKDKKGGVVFRFLTFIHLL